MTYENIQTQKGTTTSERKQNKNIVSHEYLAE